MATATTIIAIVTVIITTGNIITTTQHRIMGRDTTTGGTRRAAARKSENQGQMGGAGQQLRSCIKGSRVLGCRYTAVYACMRYAVLPDVWSFESGTEGCWGLTLRCETLVVSPKDCGVTSAPTLIKQYSHPSTTTIQLIH
jgi:hypothetical protein